MIVGCKKAVQGDEYLVLIRWMGLDDDGETWEFMSWMLEDAPAVLSKGLKCLRLSLDDKKKLRGRYGFSL